MKVTVETKKGLEKNLKVFVDKNTINKELDVKYDQLKNDVMLKVMSGKLEFDTTTYIIAKAINNQIMNGGKTKK